MTHKDIYTKFMIEYDKALMTSSYPSLTPYEIAVILDKAYLAVIAQKLTGNNPRTTPFEYDTKAIEDMRPLVVTYGTPRMSPNLEKLGISEIIPNAMAFDLNKLGKGLYLYYLQSLLRYHSGVTRTVELVSHENAKKFILTATNTPWIKNSVAFIEDHIIIYLYDPLKKNTKTGLIPDIPICAYITYIKAPNKFAMEDAKTVDFSKETKFELSDTMAEEIINQAIIFAAENVESTRLTTKIQTRSLES